MDPKEKLAKEIESLIEALGDMTAGSDEYKRTSDDLAKLLSKFNEMNRNDCEYWDKQDAREKDYEIRMRDHELREKQLTEEKTDHIVKNSLTAASIFGGFALTIWGTLKSLKFEETGSVTTNSGREFIKKLFNWKK